MLNARDQILLDELSRRALIDLGAAGPVIGQRPADLARALVQHKLVEPATLARILSELARAEYVCDPCRTALKYAELAAFPELRCPTCGGELVTRAESDSRMVRRLGRYRLQHELGRGAMGVVYLAESEDLGRKFALKVVPQGVDRDALERFRREADVASRIAGDGIVPVYDVGFDSGRMFYAMEYVAGETLKDRLRAGPLQPREAARIVASLARTVARVHEAGVVHRDIKPGNVLLDAHGNARLTDFGLAQDLATDQALTATGWMLGSPAYMAPEQAADSKRAGPASDVYALGAVLYRCLTGERPHDAPSLVEMLSKKQHFDPEPIRYHDASLSPTLERICQEAMARLPAARPSADALADALEAWLERRPTPVRRALFGAGLLAALVAAAGLGYAATAWRGGEPARPSAPQAAATDPAPVASAEAPPARMGLAALGARVAEMRRRGARPDRVLEALLAQRGAVAAEEADRLEVLIVDHFARLGRAGEVRERAAGLELRDPEAARVLDLLVADTWVRDERERARRRLEVLARATPRDAVALVADATLTTLARVAPRPGQRARSALSPALQEELQAWVRRGRPRDPLARIPDLLLRIRWSHHLAAQLLLDDAQVWLDELAATDGDHAHLLWAQVLLAQMRRDLPKARQGLERLVAQAAPEVPGNALQQLAQVRFNLGDTQAALRGMERLMRLPRFRDDLTTQMNLGMMLHRIGRRAQARAVWLRAARGDPAGYRRFLVPAGPRGPVLLGEILPGLRLAAPATSAALEEAAAARAASGRPDARPALKRACVVAMRARPWAEIAAALGTLTQASDPGTLRVVAALQLGRDQLDAAAGTLARAAERGATDADLAWLRADLLRRRGSTSAAAKRLEQLGAQPGMARPAARAAAALLRGAPDRALELLAKVEDVDLAACLRAEAKLALADALLASRRDAPRGETLLLEALFALDRAVAAGAALRGRPLAVRSRVLTRLCFSWGVPNRYQGLARSELTQTLALLPGVEHRLAIGRQIARTPLPAGAPHVWALGLVREAVRREPQRAEGWWTQGVLLLTLQRPGAEVLDAWRRAKQLDPQGTLPERWRTRFTRTYPDQTDALRAALSGG